MMLQCNHFPLQDEKWFIGHQVTKEKVEFEEKSLEVHASYLCALSYLVISLNMTIELKIRLLILNINFSPHVTLVTIGKDGGTLRQCEWFYGGLS